MEDAAARHVRDWVAVISFFDARSTAAAVIVQQVGDGAAAGHDGARRCARRSCGGASAVVVLALHAERLNDAVAHDKSLSRAASLGRPVLLISANISRIVAALATRTHSMCVVVGCQLPRRRSQVRRRHAAAAARRRRRVQPRPARAHRAGVRQRRVHRRRRRPGGRLADVGDAHPLDDVRHLADVGVPAGGHGVPGQRRRAHRRRGQRVAGAQGALPQARVANAPSASAAVRQRCRELVAFAFARRRSDGGAVAGRVPAARRASAGGVLRGRVPFIVAAHSLARRRGRRRLACRAPPTAAGALAPACALPRGDPRRPAAAAPWPCVRR